MIHHFSGTSHVAQSDSELAKFEASGCLKLFFTFLRLFLSRVCCVVPHIVLLVDQCLLSEGLTAIF